MQVELKSHEKTPTPGQKMTFHEYLKAYHSVEGVRTEWLAGEVAIYKITSSTQHNQILGFLYRLLDDVLSRKGLGIVLLAGIPMYWSDEKPAREPDLLVVFNEHQVRIKATHLDGIADIVVEIISPDSDGRDRGDKFVEYEAAGVPEYWLFDPIRSEAVIYALGEDKRYHARAKDAQGRLVSSVLPGFAPDPAVLWRGTLPRGPELVSLVEQMGQ